MLNKIQPSILRKSLMDHNKNNNVPNPIHALRKSLSFLEQQDNDNINIRVNDLLAVRRLISGVSCYHKLQYKQSSLEKFFR